MCTDILDTKSFYSTLISSWLWLSMFFDCTLWLIVYNTCVKTEECTYWWRDELWRVFHEFHCIATYYYNTPNNSFSQLFIIIKHKNFLLHFTWKLFLKPQQSIYVWNVKPYQELFMLVGFLLLNISSAQMLMMERYGRK